MQFARPRTTVLVAILAATSGASPAQQLTDTLVVGGLAHPVDLVFPRPSRIYVAEKRGTVRIVDQGVLQTQPLLDISEEVGNYADFGLLGIALDPSFASNGHLYLSYVVDRHHLLNFGTPAYSPTTDAYFDATIVRVTRFTCNPATDFQTVLPGSRLVLLGESATTGPAITSTSHGACALQFGRDGTLLVAVGDGAEYGGIDLGSASTTYYLQALTDGILVGPTNVGALRAQQIDSLNGKILRLDPATGDGVPSNPFFAPGSPRSARSRVFALGFRNPCRIALQPDTGSTDPGLGQPGLLFVGDVGWSSREELDVVTTGGQNFGWPLFEGMLPMTAYASSRIDNPFAANPLASQSCAPFFAFQDLLLQDNGGTLFFQNPCNPAIGIALATPTFRHALPSLDWAHGAADTRVPVNTGTAMTFAQIGTPASGVSGAPFAGNCVVAGTWHSGLSFPTAFGACYYQADFVSGAIQRLSFDDHGHLTAVAPLTTVQKPTRLVEGPDHDLYYLSYHPFHQVRRLSFGLEPPPVAVARASVAYGATPLTLELDARESFDPDGQLLSYHWHIDKLQTSTAPQLRCVLGGSGLPTPHHIRLTVRDSAGAENAVLLPVSLDNTPPRIEQLSVTNGGLFATTAPSILPLTATVADDEHGGSGLSYEWQVTLHHGVHEHPEAPDTLPVTTATLTPTPDDGEFYAYTIALTVTDAAGLSTTRRSWLFPERAGATTSVLLTQPAGGDVVTLGQQVTFAAIATGPVHRVEFRVGDELVGIATSPPYEAVWTSTKAGTLLANALAVAVDGTASSSRGTEFTVQAPRLSLARIATLDADAREDLAGPTTPVLDEPYVVLGAEDGFFVTALRFVDLEPPPGSRILSAHVDFTSVKLKTEPTWLVVACEDSLSPAPLSSNPGDLANRLPGAAFSWLPPPWGESDSSTAQRTPDLADLLQPLVADPGWSQTAVVLMYGILGVRSAVAVDWDPARAPLLRIEWLPPTPPQQLLAGEVGADDANELVATGSVNAMASDLVLGGDPGAEHLAALRFTLNAPPGAVVDSARLRLSSAAADAGPATWSVRVQAADDAPAITTTQFDVSSRALTATSIAWTPPEWQPGHSGAPQRSPELRTLLQEILDRPGWTAGNHCVIVVTGTGKRRAYGLDAGQRLAPILELSLH